MRAPRPKLTVPPGGSLRVWRIPQVPGNPFHVPVPTIESALLMLNALAEYDAFLLREKIRPGYLNVGGLEVFEDGEWVEWHDPKTDEDIEEYQARISQG